MQMLKQYGYKNNMVVRTEGTVFCPDSDYVLGALRLHKEQSWTSFKGSHKAGL